MFALIIKIHNNAVEARINTCGGSIESVINLNTGEEHLWQYDPDFWPRRTSVCFPVCGRLLGDVYTYKGKEYNMPMHGFLREKDLQVISYSENELILGLVSDTYTRAVFPFDFCFELISRVVGSTLEVIYRVRNTGKEEMFYSVGSHYTYHLPDNEKDCFFYFSKPQKAGRFIPENGIFGPKSSDVFHGNSRLSLDGLFSPSSVVMDLTDIDSDYIGIGTETRIFTAVKQEGFSSAVLWAKSPESCPFVCIEYWAGMPECIGNDGELSHKKGIQSLAPGCEQRFLQIIDTEVKL